MAELVQRAIGSHEGDIQDCTNSQEPERSLVGRVAGQLAGGPIGPQAGSLSQIGVHHLLAFLHPGMGQ